LPKELERLVREVLDPVLLWEEILAGFLTQSTHNDCNWKMPNMRYLHTGLYLPGLNVPDLGTIAVIIDTSASISQKELN
jgi:predicted metal-dependent peptidase